VTVTRRIDGTFQVPARINDREVRFLFDTGASAVVLSAETAAAIGIPPESLKFRVPVSTANGRALAAPVTIDRLSIGPIEIRRVPALVAREGMLDGNLLGQTVLERLESYEVRGKRLVLRAAKS
jgi:aspartyl protease family protein